MSRPIRHISPGRESECARRLNSRCVDYANVMTPTTMLRRLVYSVAVLHKQCNKAFGFVFIRAGTSSGYCLNCLSSFPHPGRSCARPCAIHMISARSLSASPAFVSYCLDNGRRRRRQNEGDTRMLVLSVLSIKLWSLVITPTHTEVHTRPTNAQRHGRHPLWRTMLRAKHMICIIHTTPRIVLIYTKVHTHVMHT